MTDITRAAMVRRGVQLAAIEAIAEGRLAEAIEIIEKAAASVVSPGQCRYCGCTDQRGCAIVVPGDDEEQPMLVRCSWVDPDRTVCSNLACLTRWQRDAPAEMDVDLHDSVSRLVLP